MAGEWKPTGSTPGFGTRSGLSRETVGNYPTSTWNLINLALNAGYQTFEELNRRDPSGIAAFLERYADLIDIRAPDLAEIGNEETALPIEPRLLHVEIPRTTDQLRQAAEAVRSRSWRDPVINTSQNVARIRQAIPGVVVVMGPNNFPFAFNAVGGGDFAAAIGTGHPILAKANPGHPGTTEALAKLALQTVREVGLPPATVQMVYDMDPGDGLRLVGDSRVAATAFTGSRRAGLALKKAADQAGNPIYLEMSATNPLVILEHALSSRGHEIAAEVATSITLGSGQFCTKPGLVFVPSTGSEQFIEELSEVLELHTTHPLLGPKTHADLYATVERLREAGANTVIQKSGNTAELEFPSTVLHLNHQVFLTNPDDFQQEAFGNVTTLVTWTDTAELVACLSVLRGTLAASIYSADGDEPSHQDVISVLQRKAGRLVANRAPTGVQVVAAMNHGGPYPATGHPGFTSVGIPESFKRFTMLQTYDNFPDHLLPPELQAANPFQLERIENE